MRRTALAAVLLLAAAAPAPAREVAARPGDTVFSIASRELGARGRWREVARLNGIREPLRALRAGRVLRLPDDPPGAAEDSIEAPPPTEAVYEPQPPVEAAPPSEAPPALSDALPSSVEAAPPAAILEALPADAAPLWPADLRPASGPAPPGGEWVALEAAVAIGLARSPEIRAALAEVERVRGEIGVALSGGLPRISATADARRTETWKSISALGLDEATFGGTLQVSQALYTFGRLSHAVASATAEEAAALAALSDARLAARAGITRAYLDALLARARLVVARESVENAESLRRRARAREAAGAGTRFDVVRAEADRAAALAEIVSAQSEVEIMRESLAAAMGLSPGARLIPVGDLLYDAGAPLPVPPSEAERIALAERPDLAILAHRTDAARSRAEYERALGRPTLEAVGSATYTRHEYITASPFFRGQDASSGYAGVSLTVPIFDGHRVRESARAQDAARARLEADAERARLEALREVRAIYFELAAARETLAARRASARAAREAWRMAGVSFEAGRATALDVIQASFALAQARRAEAEAAHAYRAGLARLVRATGSEETIRKEGDSE